MATDAWLTLLQAAQQVSSRPWLDALKHCGSAEALVAAPRACCSSAASQPTRSPSSRRLTERSSNAAARGSPVRAARSITFGSSSYPPRLAQLPDAPLALWVEGSELALLSSPQLAIVGSRSPTTSGRETAEQFARYLSERGLTITSGLATGIDGASHRGALPALGGTVAVLGSGIDVIFPRAHAQLAADIAARGLLVSEYAPGVEPQKYFFPARNRIIAGLSLGTLVVEATRRSGSLITAGHAMDYGREVFAIPGSIHNPLARGCHHLIRQGAKLVEEAADILVELAPQLARGGHRAAERRKHAGGGRNQPARRRAELSELIEAMGFSPIAIAELSARAKLTTAEVSSMLLLLELEGLVEALPGGRYSRLGKKN